MSISRNSEFANIIRAVLDSRHSSTFCVIRDDEGNVYDIISGTFFVCAAPPDSDHFTGLTDRQVKTYMEQFAMPEMFLDVGGDLFVLPYL